MVKRKATIQVVEYLKAITLEELKFLVKLANDKDNDMFFRFLKAEAERKKNIIWRLPEGDPVKLAIEKAALRGGIESLYIVFDMIRESPNEMERRLKESKNG